MDRKPTQTQSPMPADTPVRTAGSADDLATVRQALRLALETRGYDVGGDTARHRRDLYIKGTGDRARALFETQPSAAVAAETMYQGRWTADLPPRVAVIPATETDDPWADLLRQAGLLTLGYTVAGDVVGFPNLDDLLGGLQS